VGGGRGRERKGAMDGENKLWDVRRFDQIRGNVANFPAENGDEV